MGFFDFIKPIKKEAQQVFGFLSNSSVGKTATNVVGRALGAPGQVASTLVTNPTARNEAISAAQGFAKVPETVARSFAQEQATLINKVPGIHIPNNFGESAPNTGLREAIYGKGSIKSYQNRYSGTTSDLQKKGLGKAAAPLALLGTGINIAGDVTGGGAEKKAGEQLIENLAKATAESEVKKLLANKFSPKVVDKIAPYIVKATDRNVISNIIRRETDLSPSLARVSSDIIPTSVAGETSAVGKGSAIPISDVKTVAQSSIPQPTTEDVFGKVADALKGTPTLNTSGKVARKGDMIFEEGVPGITSLQEKQAGINTAERQSRLAAAGQSSVGKTGEEALNARLGQYKGEFQKVDTKNLLDHVHSTIDEPTYSTALDNFLSSPNLRPYEQTTAGEAWRSFYRDGKLPRPYELKLFEKAGGTEFANTIKTTAIESMSNISKLKMYATQVLGLPKAIMASFDISGGGRQGAFLGTRYGGAWLEGEKAAAKSFISEDAAKQYLASIENSKYAQQFDAMNLDLITRGKGEEAFPTSLAEKIPIVNNSDRAYTVGLSVQRARTAEKVLSNLEENGFKIGQRSFLGFKHGGEVTHDLAQLSDSQMKSLGKYINTATGRGDLGKFLEKHATTLQSAFFSPRLWKSRLDLLNPVFYAKLDGPAQKLAIQNAGTFAAVAATVLGVAAAAGATIETDPRSSDFLKIKVGDTRYDILGGFQQNLVFAWRQISGEKKSSLTGKVSSLTSGKPFQSDRLSVLSDLIQNKENPVFAEFQKQLSGKDKAGNALTPESRLTSVGNLVVPLSLQDTYKTAKNTGNLAKGVAKSLPGFVGAGVGTYGTKDIKLTDNQQKYVNSLTDKNQIKATTEFLQLSKTGPDRTKYSDKIKAALKAGDTQKAISLAQEYNQAYSDTYNEWRKKYPQYRGDAALTKKFGSDLITDASLSRWSDSIKKETQP